LLNVLPKGLRSQVRC